MNMWMFKGSPTAIIIGSMVSVAAGAACYGPHTINYIDSTRTEGSREIDHDFDDGRLPTEKCGPAGVARIETYSGWFDMFASYLTYSDPDRSADIICAKEE